MLLAALGEQVLDLVDGAGEAVLGLGMFVETVFPPIPSELMLPFAGFQAQSGQMNVAWAWIAATIGSVAGATFLWFLGVWLGRDRLLALSDKRWFFISSRKDLERGERIFARHGWWMVLVGRCIPLVRSVISIPAGLVRMNFVHFLALTTVGSGLWNAILMTAGWHLGPKWRDAANIVGNFSYVALGLLVAFIAWAAWRRWSRRGESQRIKSGPVG